MIRRVAPLVLLLAVAFATDRVHARLLPASQAERADRVVPKPAYAKALAMGFDSVIADYHWIQAVQLVGDESVNPQEHAEYLGKVVDVVTTLDPWVDHPYRFAAIWLVDTAEQVRHGNALLRKGIEHHPNEWRNHFYLGFNYFFYLGENKSAAEALAKAAAIEGSPAYLARLVARLRSRTHDLEAAGLLLSQLVRDTEDDVRRAAYQAALDEIEVEHRARMLERAREAFNQLRGRDLAGPSLDELTTGPHPLLARLPSAEPSSIPPQLGRASTWRIQRKTGRIVSTYYGRRYELHFHSSDGERRERMQAENAEAVSKVGEERDGA